jgi:hypothetical protein
MTTRQAGVVDTESHRLGDGFNHWSYELDFTLYTQRYRSSPRPQKDVILLLDVPKESLHTSGKPEM